MSRRLSLSIALVLCAASPALAQKKKKDKAPAAAPAPDGAAAPDVTPTDPAAPAPLTPEQIEAQKAAVEEFKKGKALEDAGDLDGAIAQYEKAFGLYPDPELQFLLGEVVRKKGDQLEDFGLYARAVEHYKKYLELAPEGRAAEPARQRIAALEEGIANAKAIEEKQAADQRAAAEAAAAAEKQAADAKRAEHEGTQLALDLSLTAGSEPDLTGIARLMAGGLLGWGRFAFEGHVGFAGFLPIKSDVGVSARELTVLDLGARYAFTSDRFVGPFVGVGGSFGLFTGKPRERSLQDDAATCAGFEGEDCVFVVDKDLTGRLALGYGFESSEKTTVALRLDLSYLMFSVDGEQGIGNPPAAQVEKPQRMFALLVGLEFMHWP